MEIVPFLLAKKLKEKGFPQDIQHCIGWYPTEYYKNSCIGEYFEGELQEIEDYYGDRISAIHIIENEKKGVIAPTISQVLKWLREEKKIYIMIDRSFSVKNSWHYVICNNDDFEHLVQQESIPNRKWELAALAGIEYVVNNLI